MRLFVTALVFLIGLFMILIAMSVLFQPATTAPSLLGIVPEGAHAMSTLRGDVQGFFSIIGITMLWGAWKRSGDLLLVPAIIMVLVVIGRLVSVAQDGMYDGFAMAVGMEVAITALLLWARALLPHHALQDVGD
jgi:nitrate reductase gamma subunit